MEKDLILAINHNLQMKNTIHISLCNSSEKNIKIANMMTDLMCLTHPCKLHLCYTE